MKKRIGRPSTSMTACNGVHDPLRLPYQTVPPVAAPPFSHAQAGRRSVGLEINRIDYYRLGNCRFEGQPLHDPGEDSQAPSPLPLIVSSLRRAILLRCITPPQAIAVDADKTAQHPPVIDPGHAMLSGKTGRTRAICASSARKDCSSSPPSVWELHLRHDIDLKQINRF